MRTLQHAHAIKKGVNYLLKRGVRALLITVFPAEFFIIFSGNGLSGSLSYFGKTCSERPDTHNFFFKIVPDTPGSVTHTGAIIVNGF